MRYVIRLLVPAFVLVGVVYLLTRRPRHDGTTAAKRPGGDASSDTVPFIAILIVSAAVALGTAYLLESLWESP